MPNRYSAELAQGLAVQHGDFLGAYGQRIGSADGSDYAYVYDGLGRVTSETQSLRGLAIDITYATTFDANGRRTKLLAGLGAYNVNDGRKVQRLAVEKCGAGVGEGLSLNQGLGAFQ